MEIEKLIDTIKNSNDILEKYQKIKKENEALLKELNSIRKEHLVVLKQLASQKENFLIQKFEQNPESILDHDLKEILSYKYLTYKFLLGKLPNIIFFDSLRDYFYAAERNVLRSVGESKRKKILEIRDMLISGCHK